MILNKYSDITEENIRSKSHAELIEAVLRMLKVREIKCQDHLGSGILTDDLADAFRGRK